MEAVLDAKSIFICDRNNAQQIYEQQESINTTQKNCNEIIIQEGFPLFLITIKLI